MANSYRDSAGTRKYRATGVAMRYEQSADGHTFFTAPSGTAGNAITFTQAMTLDASGNISLGFTGGASRLEVRGPMYVPAANFKQLASFYSTDAIGTDVGAGITLGGIYQNTDATAYAQIAGIKENATSGNYAGVLAFYSRTNGDTLRERARIDSSGNLLVGKTATGDFTTGFEVQPAGAIISYRTNGVAGIFGRSNDGELVRFNRGGVGAVGSISISSTTTSYNTTSDQRLKENIENADSASSLIDALQVRQFDWKSDNSHQRYGFIAQELVTVASEAVHQPEDSEQMMAVDYSKLVPMLVKEVQSLRVRVAQLESN
jgi:hypothetical protein